MTFQSTREQLTGCSPSAKPCFREYREANKERRREYTVANRERIRTLHRDRYRLRNWGTADESGRPDKTVYRGVEHPNWRGDDICYNTAHKRTQYLRGKASEHRCVDCGSQAQQWAYQYTAGDRERTELMEDTRVGRARELAYSPDAEHYAAMCESCHIKFDKRERVSA